MAKENGASLMMQEKPSNLFWNMAGAFVLCLWCHATVFGMPSGEKRGNDVHYYAFNKIRLEGESWTGGDRDRSTLTVRAFDLKKNKGKNGIAVCGRRLYIFSARGTLLSQSSSVIFDTGTSRMRIAKLSKDGYRDTIIASGDSIRVFDRLGINMSSLNAPVFFSKDINDDGIDELIVDGGAYYTNDGGASWRPLWANDKIQNMQDVAGLKGDESFCYNQYLGSVYSVDKNGKVLFQAKPGGHIRCLTAGDLDGDGIRNDIAVSAGNGTVYIYGKTGDLINSISLKISGEMIDLNETMTIKTGRLRKGANKDDIVEGGRRGVVACTSDGDILWSYIKWPGGNRYPATYALFIEDLNNDGANEVVAGKGDEIFVFSNTGRLLDTFMVQGDLSSWKNPSAKMDVADVDDDGYKEIMAVTSDGWFYIFKQKTSDKGQKDK